jgi:shikimate dehydrogenase
MRPPGSPPRLLLGLIGSGIGPSLSPALHERAATAAGFEAHYHLIDLEQDGRRPADLATLLEAARRVGFAGLNITHPCKEAVLRLLDTVEPGARTIGAVNTVVFRDGASSGHNTDAIGFRRAFEGFRDTAGIRAERVLMLGAGGAGRAVAHALLEAAVGTLSIADGAPGKAAELVAQLSARFGDGRAKIATASPATLAASDGLVNATPCGMAGYPPSALDLDGLRADLWVADVVYFPLETPLLRAARGRGAATLDGGGMCVHQAAAAFQLFTGRAADVAAMTRDFRALVAARGAS